MQKGLHKTTILEIFKLQDKIKNSHKETIKEIYLRKGKVIIN